MIIPMVIAAVVLGKAFDMQMLRPTDNYVFDPASVMENLVTIPQTYTSANYRLLESSSDVNDFLDISGELVLKAKLGEARIQGYGHYLLPKVNREKTVEILITVNHQTVTETFPSYTTQREEYKSHDPKYVGTHYIRSIIYGGQLIISYKLVSHKMEYMEEIKAAVTANLQASGRLDIDAKGKLDKLSKEVEGKCTISIQAYGTTGAISPPTNLDEVLQLVDEYPSLVQKLNDGKGSPLRLDLEPISSINPIYPQYSRNMALDLLSDEATNKYDDLRVAESEFREWDKTKLWNDKQQGLINEFNSKLQKAKHAMLEAINDLDLSQPVSDDHFATAFRVYGENGDNIPNRYMRNLNKLIHEVENIPYHWFPFTKSVTHYIHWGSLKCSLPSPEPIFIGYAASSPKGYGSGSSVQCLDSSPNMEPRSMSPTTKVSYLTGLKYLTPNGTVGNVYCAHCRLTNATAVVTIPGRTDCPSEMKLEYSGYLATNGDAESRFVCMDIHPDDNIDNLPLSNDEFSGKLIPVWMTCDDCDEDEQEKFVACVVCSR